ncbi:DUF2157 domain-containing protein [bacterium]|nr:DUF2157 domain-containing protein [bacterium]
MANPELLEFIIQSLARLQPEDEISAALQGKGWSKEEIDEALARAAQMLDPGAAPPQAPAKPVRLAASPAVDLSRVTAARIFLFLGAVVIVSAAVFFISINWEEWSGLQRFGSILVPMLVCAAAGLVLWFISQRAVAVYFLLTAGMLAPFVTYMAIWGPSAGQPEYYLEQPVLLHWGFSLGAGTIIYLLCRRFLPHPSWSLLAGLGFVLCTAFSIAGILKNDPELTVHRFALVASVLVLLVGLYAERGRHTVDAMLLYLVGWVGLVFSLLVLGFSGGMLPEDIVDNYAVGGAVANIYGISTVLAGIIGLVLAYLTRFLSGIGFAGLAVYRGILGFFGCGMLLSGAFLTGVDDELPVYETALLLLSLAAIFIGQRIRVRSFLYLGTLFLIIYVFSTGFEYFEDQVGWPIILFCTGLVSMVIGFAVDRWSRVSVGRGGEGAS